MHFEGVKTPKSQPNAFLSDDNPDDFAAWAERNDHWIEQTRPKIRRAKRERAKEPLILCGHGVSLNIDRGTLYIRDGLTHHPQERATHRLYRGAITLPSRIIMLDGSGSLSFDVITWLSEQSIPLVRIDWKGEVVSVIGGAGFAQSPERVQWQTDTRNTPSRRLEFSCDLIAAKLQACLKTLVEVIPDSASRARAIARNEAAFAQLRAREVRSIEDVRAIEATAAATYFNAWKGIPLVWRTQWKYPVPDEWLTIGPRRSTGPGRFATNKNASHPLNAMLNYAYAALRSQIHAECAGEGYDPRRGIMHHDRDDTQAFVYDLIEPRRPVVDAAVLSFVLKAPLTGADFVLRADGVCRVGPQLARRVAQFGLSA